MKLLGRDLPYKFSGTNPADIDKLANAEECFAGMQDGTPTGTRGYAEWLTTNCRCIQEFFTVLFGDGADREMFGDETDFSVCVDAVMAFYEEVGIQAKKFEEKYSKYSLNRTERRGKK